MDRGYYTIIGLLAVGVAYGFFRKQPTERKKSNSGWIGLLVIGILVGGLVIADNAGSEKWAWFFGLSLMVATLIMLFFAIGSSVGSFLKLTKDKTSKTSKQRSNTVVLGCLVLAPAFLDPYPWVTVCLLLAGVFIWLKSKKKDSASTKAET